MRIFVDARVLRSKSFSGISEYGSFLIDNLLKIDKKNEYSLFLNSFNQDLAPREFLERHKEIKIINYRLPNRVLDLSNYFFSFPQIDKLVKADLFYSPHINILSFKDPHKHVMTIHDLSFVHSPHFFSLSQKLWHLRQNYEDQIRKSGKIIADSDFTREDVGDTFKVPLEKIKRIYPGINPFYRPLKNDEDLEKFRKLKKLNKPFLFYLGAIEPRKNISSLIKAFGFLKEKKKFFDLELIIAGPKGWLCDNIFKEAHISRARDSIKFWGEAKPIEALYLYNSASLFVYPSFFEGFGFPPLEAQACGLPVISSNRTSLPEILGDSALLIEPSRIEEMVFGIESGLTDEVLRDNLVQRGFENIKRFNWQETAEELFKVFESYNA